MKKIISILMMCLAFAFMANAATFTYYVETGGDNNLDGLSEANAFADIETAIDSAQARFDEDNVNNNDFIINLGAGTFTAVESNIFSFANATVPATFSFVGAGADLSIIEGKAKNTRFASLTNVNNNLIFNFNNLQFNNFTMASNAGGLFSIGTTDVTGVEIDIDQCVISDITCRQGGIIFCKSDVSLSITNSYLTGLVTIDDGWVGGPIEMQAGSLDISNCVFDSNTVNANFQNRRSVGTCFHLQLSSGSMDVSIVNNTFIDNQVINSTSNTKNNGTFMMITNASNNFTGTIANNIFVDNLSDGATVYDVCFTSTTNVTLTNCTNNILNSQLNFTTTGNDIDPAYTFASPEVLFVEDEDGVVVETTANGVPYFVAAGSGVVGSALQSAQTTTDIAGITRATPGCIGASEYVPAAADQFISFEELTPTMVGSGDITLPVNATSGLPIVYTSSDESVATVSGNVLHPVASGNCVITANQAGDVTYDAANTVTREFSCYDDVITYYVRPDGSSVEHGLSESHAFPTLFWAAKAAVAEGAATTYNIDVDGEITNNKSASLVFDRADDILVTIMGAGADQTLYQMKNDSDYDWVIASLGRSAGRVIASPKNSGAGSLDIEVKDMTFRNFGFTNTNGGGFLNANVSGADVDVLIERCSFERGAARGGALIQATNIVGTVVMEDCYVSEMTTINNSAYVSPIIVNTSASFVAKNCVFANSKRAISTKTNWKDSKSGSVIQYTPNTVNSSLTLVNNTFVGDSSMYTDMTVAQSVVYVKSTVANVPVTIANNLFVENGTASASVDHYDVHVDAGSSAIAFTSSTNNVMNSQSGFGATGNDIDVAYAYTSPEIDFTMLDGAPEVFMTANGVSYFKSDGASIFEGGLASVATMYDIAGTERAVIPSVGAYEAEEDFPTGCCEVLESGIALYPNPTSNVLYITGDVTRVELFNISGRMVQSSALVAGSINVSDLAKGVYFVKCQNESGNVISTSRILKN